MMLKVEIGNIDDQYYAIYDTDDKMAAANRLLNKLKNERGFYKENTILCVENELGVFGFLQMPNQSLDDILFDEENSFYVSVTEYNFGDFVGYVPELKPVRQEPLSTETTNDTC